jgi:pSer/pThr/pTyr-binding forkhead associated (FHA) protein
MSDLYLVKYPNKPVLISKSGSFSIGRMEDNTIVIPDSRVSRRHAEIVWNADQNVFYIHDLQSSNGTFVNNKKISGNPHPLSDNDKIRISATVFASRIVNDSSVIENEFRELRKNTQTTQTEIISITDIHSLTQPSGLTGDLSNLCPIELFQMLDTGNKTGRVLIRTESGQKGSFTIVNGQIVSAEFNNLIGENAVYEVLAYNKGIFTFKPEQIFVDRPEITSSVARLLLEGCKVMDERLQHTNS